MDEMTTTTTNHHLPSSLRKRPHGEMTTSTSTTTINPSLNDNTIHRGDEEESSATNESNVVQFLQGLIQQLQTTSYQSKVQLRLEAIFYPKFENERANDNDHNNHDQKDTVRDRILRRVSYGHGYAEVSLKHSGSLLLWSGGDGFYSKNSTDNAVALVGHVLLLQHFARMQYAQQQQQFNASSRSNTRTTTTTTVKDWQEASLNAFETCSNYVKQHRLTLAFEVVTAVLGDHGERPKVDYLVLTAVAQRGNGREHFWSTRQLLELAQQFQLPHNDYFVGMDGQSVQALLNVYDDCRYTGTAGTVIPALQNNATTSIVSMLPHVQYQGDLLEGLVIRYVPFTQDQNNHGNAEKERLEELSQESIKLKELLHTVPACWEILRNTKDREDIVPVLTCNLREVALQSMESGANKLDQLAHQLRTILGQSLPRQRNVTLKRLSMEAKTSPRVLEDFDSIFKVLASSDTVDVETRRIATMLSSLQEKKALVEYVLCRECLSQSEIQDARIRWLLIIHVRHDSIFHKYERNRTGEDMHLFRGLVIQICDSDDSQQGERHIPSNVENSVNSEKSITSLGESSTLMLKMKLLKYMVRTFICRNGLHVIRKGGVGSFVTYANDIFSSWKVPSEVREQWLPLIRGWGFYASRVFDDQGTTELEPLSEDNYLTHLDRFSETFERGQVKIDSNMSEQSFRGLLIVVAADKTVSDPIGRYLASRLQSDFVSGVREITKEALNILRSIGDGKVCSVVVTDGVSKLKRFLPEFKGLVSVLFVGCSDDEIRAYAGSNQNERKKLHGMMNAWRSCSFANTYEVNGVIARQFINGSETTKLPALDQVVSSLLAASSALPAPDSRTGVLFFFPGIPGCGKSSISGADSFDQIRKVLSRLNPKTPRNLIIRVGDRVSGNYWNLVTDEMLRDRSCVYIADKNVPSSTWRRVAGVVLKTRTVGVPVVYGSALRTTTVSGVKMTDGTRQETPNHMYPFSLRFLAVCLARVLGRKHGSHIGRLDAATNRAALIVVKFYALYRDISAADFCRRIVDTFVFEGALISSPPVDVPFFVNGSPEDLPEDLNSLLVEALQVQVRRHLAFFLVHAQVCSQILFPLCT